MTWCGQWLNKWQGESPHLFKFGTNRPLAAEVMNRTRHASRTVAGREGGTAVRTLGHIPFRSVLYTVCKGGDHVFPRTMGGEGEGEPVEHYKAKRKLTGECSGCSVRVYAYVVPFTSCSNNY